MLVNEITIYTTRFCPYCLRAKHLLAKKKSDGHVFTLNEIPVDSDMQRRKEMENLSGAYTVPQIWIGDQHIGGCDELVTLERSGQLDAMLRTGD